MDFRNDFTIYMPLMRSDKVIEKSQVNSSFNRPVSKTGNEHRGCRLSYQSGIPSFLGKSEWIKSQGCALATKMLRLGLYQLGSSKLPAYNTIAFVFEPLTRKRGEPQVEQNPLRIMCPLSAGLSNQVGSPVDMENWDVLTATAAK